MNVIGSLLNRRRTARWLLALGLCLQVGLTTVAAQSASRRLDVDVYINQIGYRPEAAKRLVVPGQESRAFEVRRLPSNEVAYRGTLRPAGGDFGAYLVGDFSEVTVQGTYFITVDDGASRSYPFRIGEDIYDEAMGKIVSYFGSQRCGASRTGYLSPCHIDDGVRADTGEHQDVSGGWHDASDLRKWVSATLYGMVGLSNLLATLPSWNSARVLEELRWGNQYFLKMQEPAGYVMSYVGGDLLEHGDNNRWTDNEIGPAGGELRTVYPSSEFGSRNKVTVMGSADDRVINTDPVDDMAQFTFVASEARTALLTRDQDPAYAEKTLEAARRALRWSLEKDVADDAGEYGALIQAAVALYQVTEEERYRLLAAEYARRLLQLQVTEPIDSDEPIRGFFETSSDNEEPWRNISRGRLPMLALCDVLETFPEHKDASIWKEALAMHTQEYLLPMASRNSFGIVPFGFYLEDPGGDRRIGKYWYRYTMNPDQDWWVGINAHVASAGVGLAKAARILDDPRLAALAQRQLDWIVGANPFAASTMEGVGYNHPGRFVNGSEFSPPTPRLDGAVMNGLGGTVDDQPAYNEDSWQNAEYWTPMVGYTLWLMAELSV